VLIGVNVSSVSGWLPPAVILVAAVTLVLSIGWYIGDWKLQLLVGLPTSLGLVVIVTAATCTPAFS